MMDLTPAKAATRILRYHGIMTCLIGDLVLNYYNVPRICHDVEICVSRSTPEAAVVYLCSTGLFEPVLRNCDYNNYTEYQRNIPRVRTTSWISPPQALMIFPAAYYGLEPIDKILVPPGGGGNVHFSKEILEQGLEDVASLPLPRLAPLLQGLAQRFLDTGDDMAMIAVEQLVDGMDIDNGWIQRHFGSSKSPVTALVLQQVRGKRDRIDYYSDNLVTTFLRDREEAEKVRLIPGFE